MYNVLKGRHFLIFSPSPGENSQRHNEFSRTALVAERKNINELKQKTQSFLICDSSFLLWSFYGYLFTHMIKASFGEYEGKEET